MQVLRIGGQIFMLDEYIESSELFNNQCRNFCLGCRSVTPTLLQDMLVKALHHYDRFAVPPLWSENASDHRHDRLPGRSSSREEQGQQEQEDYDHM